MIPVVKSTAGGELNADWTKRNVEKAAEKFPRLKFKITLRHMVGTKTPRWHMLSLSPSYTVGKQCT